MIIKMKQMFMHFMHHNYFVSYLSKFYWLFAENKKEMFCMNYHMYMLRLIKAYITSKKMKEIIIIKNKTKKNNN